MQTCAVLVNYKNAALTVRCLHALAQGTVKPDLIYVIDNATCEESQKVFQSEDFSIPVKFIWNKHNVGFAAANNQGVRAAQAEGFEGFVWLINNDTEPKGTALETLLQKAKEMGLTA
jgi:GT2 family glycosyltransferase